MLEFINWMEIISLWTRPTPQREPITTTTTTMFIGMTDSPYTWKDGKCEWEYR
jgi:hypothetical protein